jgi:hypothetical protein
MTGPEEFEHAFRLEQQEAEKLRFLQRAWQQGIDSGDAGEVDFSALKQEARARLAASIGEDDAARRAGADKHQRQVFGIQ